MDASTATATASNLFGNMDQKFDLATLLRNVAAAAAASTTISSSTTVTGSTATSPNSVESSSTNGPAAISNSPSPPHHHHHHAELKPIPASSLAPPGVIQRRQLPFAPIQPVYAPSGHGRQILIYDSRSHPGRRREFAYKTRFTNQSGLTTVYYRCMACRALRHRLQRSLPKEKLPAVPCIAVKNDLLINDPDFPEASDHFCTPLTINESDQRLRNTFERGHKRARMKMANSTVEETIRKVGKIRAEEGEEGDLDIWTKSATADGSSSSALLDLNGTLDGSDCSSDSIVDVLKEESPDEDMAEAEHGGYSPAATDEKPCSENSSSSAHCDQPQKEKTKSGADGGRSAATSNALKQPKLELGTTACPPPPAIKTSPLGTNSSPISGLLGTRSPRKKLDSLLKLAEMRAAAANGTSANVQQVKEERKPANVDKMATAMNGQGAQQRATTGNSVNTETAKGTTTATVIATPTSFPIQLNSMLSSGQFHQQMSNIGNQQQQNNNSAANNNNNIPPSIHAIAARLSRGSASAASELSKALAGMKGQAAAIGQQKAAGGEFMNGGEKGAPGNGIMPSPFPLMNGTGGQLHPSMGRHIAELLKKYVENNLELAPETAGNARSAGELACALFMAQTVENAELRQEVQKLRGELDSLKALVAAAAVVQNSNGHGNNSNGHHHQRH